MSFQDKKCSCGRGISVDSWSKLRLLGTMDNGRGIGELLELRLCSCGSSLSQPIGEHAPSLPRIALPSRPDEEA